jgi:hypothetical protein
MYRVPLYKASTHPRINTRNRQIELLLVWMKVIYVLDLNIKLKVVDEVKHSAMYDVIIIATTSTQYLNYLDTNEQRK